MGVCPSHSASTSRFVKPDNTHTHLHNPTNDNSAASPLWCLLPRPGCAPTAPPDRLSHRLPPPHLSPPPPPPPPPPGDRDPITRADTTRGRLYSVPPSYSAAPASPLRFEVRERATLVRFHGGASWIGRFLPCFFPFYFAGAWFG